MRPCELVSYGLAFTQAWHHPLHGRPAPSQVPPLLFREQSAQLGAPLKIGEACSFHTFCTNNYKLHFYEALSGIKVHAHLPSHMRQPAVRLRCSSHHHAIRLCKHSCTLWHRCMRASKTPGHSTHILHNPHCPPGGGALSGL